MNNVFLQVFVMTECHTENRLQKRDPKFEQSLILKLLCVEEKGMNQSLSLMTGSS